MSPITVIYLGTRLASFLKKEWSIAKKRLLKTRQNKLESIYLLRISKTICFDFAWLIMNDRLDQKTKIKL